MRVERNHGFAQGASPKDATCLTDKQADGKERPWRRNRLLADALAVAYLNLGDAYKTYAERVEKCAALLRFGEFANGTRKLIEAYFCHCRLCPMCQWRKARMLHQQVCEVVDAHWQGTPKASDFVARKSDRALFLTLTVRNSSGADLALSLTQMSKGWRHLIGDRRFDAAVTGWFRALEVTYNKETDEYHPHFHVLLMVRGDYFDKKKSFYIPQSEWIDLWGRSLRVDYRPSVDIRSVNGKAGAEMSERTRKALHEVTKYAAKPQDLYKLAPDGAEVPPGVVRVLHDALKGKRLVGWGGTFKQLRAALQLPDVDDPNTDLTDAGDVPAGTEPIAVEVYRWGIGATRSPHYLLMRRTVGGSREAA